MSDQEVGDMLNDIAEGEEAPETHESDVQSEADAAVDSLMESFAEANKDVMESSPDWMDESEELAEGENAEDEEAEAEEADNENEAEVDEDAERLVESDLLFDAEGNALEIPEGTKFKVKVDGEEMLVDVQEVVNGISGQKALSQRFTELDHERKQLEAYQARRQELTGKMSMLMNQNKVVEALELAFEAEGYDPALAMTGLFQQLTPYMDRYAQMSPEQRHEWANKMQIERQKLQTQALQSHAQKLQAEKDQYLQIREVQAQMGLDDDTYITLHNALVRERQAGTMPGGNVLPNPQDVAEYYNILTSEITVREAIAEVNPDAAQDSKYITDLANQIRQLQASGYEITPDIIRESAAQFYGQPASAEKAKKITKQLQKKGKAPKKAAPKKSRTPRDPKAHWMQNFVADFDEAGKDKTAREQVMKKWDKHTRQGRLQ